MNQQQWGQPGPQQQGPVGGPPPGWQQQPQWGPPPPQGPPAQQMPPQQWGHQPPPPPGGQGPRGTGGSGKPPRPKGPKPGRAGKLLMLAGLLLVLLSGVAGAFLMWQGFASDNLSERDVTKVTGQTRVELEAGEAMAVWSESGTTPDCTVTDANGDPAAVSDYVKTSISSAGSLSGELQWIGPGTFTVSCAADGGAIAPPPDHARESVFRGLIWTVFTAAGAFLLIVVGFVVWLVQRGKAKRRARDAAPGTQFDPPRERTWLTAGIVLGVVAALVIGGGIAFEAASTTKPRLDQLRLGGSQNFWLSDAYASGVGTVWETQGTPVATSADRSLLLVSTESESGVDSTVHDVRTGDVVHELPGIDCTTADRSNEGKVYCIEAPTTGTDANGEEGPIQPLVVVDIASGEVTRFYNAPFAVSGLRLIGAEGDRIVVDTRSQLGEAVIAFDVAQGVIVWQNGQVGRLPSECQLLHAGLACLYRASFLVLSKEDGTEVSTAQFPDGDFASLNLDSVIHHAPFAKETQIRGFDGSHSTTTDYLLEGDIPMEFEDRVDNMTVNAVDRDGNVVVSSTLGWSGGSTTFSSSGVTFPFHDTYGLVSSETGTVVASKLDQAPVNLFGTDGVRVGFVPEAAKLVDGILVSRDPEGATQVYAPAG